MRGSIWILIVVLLFYVSEINCDFDVLSLKSSRIRKFEVYWTVPTKHCCNYTEVDSELYDYYCNDYCDPKEAANDIPITILNDPGSFPHYNKKNGEDNEVNGGIPEKGSLKQHLADFENSVCEAIPDKNYTGIAVIKFLKWPPLFKQLWGEYLIYRNSSIDNAKGNETAAEQNFDRKARAFLSKTLKRAKQLRPDAKWGYYNYPYCNHYDKIKKQCNSSDSQENDELAWLLSKVDVFVQNLFINTRYRAEERPYRLKSELNEAARIAGKRANRHSVKVIPFFRYRYYKKYEFVNETEFEGYLRDIKDSGADMVVLEDLYPLENESQCNELFTYFNYTLDPVALRVKNF